MKRPCILDPAIFIWDKYAFDNNPTKYYELARGTPRFLNRLRTEQRIVVFNNELQAAIYSGYPASSLNESALSLHKKAIFQFLSSVHLSLCSYSEECVDVTTEPALKRGYFSNAVSLEIEKISSEIYRRRTGYFTFFSFDSIWYAGNDEIQVIQGTDAVMVEVVRADTKDALDEYFDRKMNVFDAAYEKHIRTDGYIHVGSRKVSPLSCYKGKNIDRCQELLEGAEAEEEGTKLYNIDRINGKWVVFRRSFGGEPNYRGNNPYHGHDEDDLTKIPDEIRQREDGIG